MQDYLDREFTDTSIARVFDELSFWSARFGMLLFDHIPIRPGLRVLDVGCATGFPLFELAHTLGPSATLTGVDIWDAAIERAREKLTIYELPNVEILRADAANLPFPDASFDLIVSNLGINNFDDPAAVISELRRVAAPGADLALTTNVQGHMQRFYDAFREVLQEAGDDDSLARLAANECHRGTVASVRRLIEKGGFTVDHVVERSFTLRYGDGSALLRHSLTLIGFLPAWRKVVLPDREKSTFDAIESRLNAIAANEGELRMEVPMVYIQGSKPMNPFEQAVELRQ